jgi:phosphatidylserine decarboxylase
MLVRWFRPATARSPTFRPVTVGNEKLTRLSIFLSVFNVHVNRSPIAGVIREVRYQRGQYLNAMNQTSAELNEQNIVTVQG